MGKSFPAGKVGGRSPILVTTLQTLKFPQQIPLVFAALLAASHTNSTDEIQPWRR